jgi:hypothetical membrane protein
MVLNYKSAAGTILFIAGVQYVSIVSLAEQYSNSTLLNFSVALTGLLLIIAAFFILKAYKSTPFTALLALAGIGTIGVGLLPVNSNEYLALAYTGYIFAGLAAILSYKFSKSPLSYLFAIMGALTLVVFVLWVAGQLPPSTVDNLVLSWMIAFGATIIGDSNKKPEI